MDPDGSNLDIKNDDARSTILDPAAGNRNTHDYCNKLKEYLLGARSCAWLQIEYLDFPNLSRNGYSFFMLFLVLCLINLPREQSNQR